MALPVSERPAYPSISAKAFEHPADRAATAALATIPLLDRVLKKLSELRFERSFQQLLLADAVRLGERQLPEVHAAHLSALRTLDIAGRPELYVAQLPSMNAMTVGSSRPVVMLGASLVKSLPKDELAAVIGHEDGHVLADHVHYATVLAILQRLLSTGLSPVGRLPLQAVVLVLLEWYRCAELSCDRAATLVVDDPMVVCRLLMDISGGGAEGLNVDAFIQQAHEYAETEDVLARPGRWLTELGRTHPYAVRRVGELTRWVAEGEFDRIRSGSYVRRGQEPPVTDQLREATEHYRRRFTEIVDRVAGGTQKLFNQFSAWLRSDGGEGDGD
ncbi:MAG TPA: M48 family metallopeptidase [Acidimicrobiales bacterium]|nr:M48 family metallopeptidase [Acidimicrobiales bacterium]